MKTTNTKVVDIEIQNDSTQNFEADTQIFLPYCNTISQAVSVLFYDLTRLRVVHHNFHYIQIFNLSHLKIKDLKNVANTVL